MASEMGIYGKGWVKLAGSSLEALCKTGDVDGFICANRKCQRSEIFMKTNCIMPAGVGALLQNAYIFSAAELREEFFYFLTGL